MADGDDGRATRIAGSDDATTLLRYAFDADPGSDEGQAALALAQQAAMRVARDLRRQARSVGGPQAARLERRAKESYFHAVLAEQLPNLAGRLHDVARDQVPAVEVDVPDTVTAAPLPVAPAAPASVVAQARVAAASVRWQPPAEVVTSYTVTPYVDTTPQAPTIVSGSLTEALIVGLTPGTSYRFTVTAANPLGSSPESAPSNAVVPTSLPTESGGPLTLDLPAFSSDPALLIDPAAEAARGFLAAAGHTGGTWRYEHLKAQAVAAAKDAMQFEQHIAQIMSLALDKLGIAEELVGDTLRQAVDDLKGATQDVADSATAPKIDDLLEDLGDVGAESLLLPRFLAWLVEVGPVRFWIGLFEAIINDLASVVPFFGGPTGFGRTKKYLQTAFDDDIDGVKTALRDAARGVLDRLDADVAEMIAPLKAAVAEVVEGTRKAMADVFEASDVVLLMTPPETTGASNVPDVDPFAQLYAELEAQVDELAEKIKTRIRSALQPLLGGGADLFKKLVITFLVLPLLAFLIIALAGGPFSAALLAAIVLVAAQELLRLLVRWLTGPLLGKVEEVKRQVVEIVGELQAFFAAQAGLIANQSPKVLLEVLASQLRQVTDFVPQTFLEETAAVLEEARNVVLRAATQLGLAAEQALGAEHATAFDAVGLDYATHLAPAPQLPGGRDPARLAGAVLLRDLGRLEQQRTALRDGKDLVFTHRLSLLRLLGDDPLRFQQFLQHREVVIDLDERELLDRAFPGVYRALIDDVAISGVLTGPVTGTVRGIPVTVTHLGESRTRVKRSANPHAPPLSLPDCFPPTAEEFVEAVVGDAALAAQLRRVFDTFAVATIGDYALVFLFAILGGVDDPLEMVCSRFKQACQEHLPAALGRAASQASCGLVNPAVVEEGTRRLVDRARFADALAAALLPPDAADRLSEKPDLEPGIAALVELLQRGLFTTLSPVGGSTGTVLAMRRRPLPAVLVVPGLLRVAREAYDGAITAFQVHIAKWGDATLEEDPDPQVRALGYASLVRQMAAETAVFNLFPDASSLTTRADPARPDRAGAPTSAPALQYRPLENRGLSGQLLVRLETIGDDDVAGQLSDTLTDLIIDVSLRACFDPDLAQTVRSSRRQTATNLSVVDALAGTVPVPLPGAVDPPTVGVSELRTVHYSLRAHRDKTLQAWAAAVQTAPAATTTLAGLLAGKAPLGRDVAFTPLDDVTSFSLELTTAAPSLSEDWLRGLADTIHVTPADLGYRASTLSGHQLLRDAELVSLGLAVIPMPDAVRADDDDLTADPLAVQVRIPAPLDAVLPGYTTGAAMPQRLRMAVDVTDPPTLADLFDAGTPLTIDVTFGDGAFATDGLYDVLFSLTYRVPVLQASTASAALT